MYYYFVSYTFSDPSARGNGFGNMGVKANKLITSMDDLQEVVDKLSEQMPNFSNFIILNFQLLREEPNAD